MLRVQIAGLPARLYEQWKTSLNGWKADLPGDISVRVIPSGNTRYPLYTKHEFGRICEAIEEGYVHIIAFEGRNARDLSSSLKYDCRVTIAPVDTNVRIAGLTDILAVLETAIDFERRWCRTIRPQDLHNPLFLPPLCFSLSKGLNNHWKLSDCYRDTVQLGAAHDALKAVIASHRQNEPGAARFWQDSRQREFRNALALHGLAPAERQGRRRFRFCFEVLAGFHYDVVHNSRASFDLIDFRNTRHERLRRANVDPWGTVRPA